MAIKKTSATNTKPASKVVVKVVKKVAQSAAAKTPAKKVATKTTNVGRPLSVVIRRRIKAQRARFHANDNILHLLSQGS